MCGIAGSFKAHSFDVEAALDAIAHRGPDGRGVAQSGDAVHGHVRLAVMDPTPASAQPFKRGPGVLSYNGELWNMRQLRAELEGMGERFTTTGDTEVAAAALDRWGPKAAAVKMDGMYALAWSSPGTHVLIRDRFGKIPLYVLRHGPAFFWASERKALSRGALPLPPGSMLDLETGELKIFYRLEDHLGRGNPEPENVHDALVCGVKRRLMSDVPLCVLTSGGLDSAAVLTIAAREVPGLVAYTAVMDTASPDLAAARRLCSELGVELREVPVPRPTLEAVRAAVLAIETSMKAQVEIALLALPLAHRMAEDGFKVCLSGEAADELFGGYGSMAIRYRRATDAEWQQLRIQQVRKMARGNFLRCNKVFMARGVECRLPFMERDLVESVLSASRAACPAGKGLLKRAVAGLVPDWVIRRRKETFQGAAGVPAACAKLVASPTRFYNAEARRVFG